MQHQTSGGAFGALPEDYLVYRAARYCNCPPWEIEDRDDYWLEKVLLYASADAEAEQINARQAARQHRQKR